jgi:predicted neuraminidase
MSGPVQQQFLAQRTASRVLLGLMMAAMLLGLDLWCRPVAPEPARAVWPVTDKLLNASTLKLQSQGKIPMPPNTPAAHASTLLALPPGHPAALMAFWFAGSRESGPDVQIAVSRFDRATQAWSPARFVVNRQLGRNRMGFGLRRLGNPVAWLDTTGRVHLFVVATGMGGWAAGRIMHLVQANDGLDFEQLSFRPVRILPLSWLWKTSHLVRAAPLALADGGMILPVYFELGVKYPVALRFGANGEFQGMVRISSRAHLLQPTLLARSPSNWLALMRDNSLQRKIGMAQTQDAGLNWQDLPDLELDNPDASVASLALHQGLLLLAHNSLPDSRSVLDLSISQNGLDWSGGQNLERQGKSSEFSYPALAWADDSLWVSYTDQRRAIAWQRFSFKPAAPKKTP